MVLQPQNLYELFYSSAVTAVTDTHINVNLT